MRRSAIAALLVTGALGALGTSWDVSWHIIMGRDSFFIPPHDVTYAAVALAGLISLSVVLSETLRVRRGGDASNTVSFFGFHAPLGFYIAGFGVLTTILAAPFDDWWHRMYGIDVTIWSPPHLAGILGGTVTGLGAVLAIASEANNRRPGWSAGWSLLLLASLAELMRTIHFGMTEAISLTFFPMSERFNVPPVPPAPWYYPVLASILLTWLLVASVRAFADQGRKAAFATVVLLGGLTVLRLWEQEGSLAGYAMMRLAGPLYSIRPFTPYNAGTLFMWYFVSLLVWPIIIVALLSWLKLKVVQRRWSPLLGGLIGLVFALESLNFYATNNPTLGLPDTAGQIVLICLVAGAVSAWVGSAFGGIVSQYNT